MSRRWPGAGKFQGRSFVDHPHMHARYVDGITIRPLRDGDTDTVATLFARLGSRSRERRFCGAKPRLGEAELAALSRVDAEHHVLVAYVERDPRPAGIAELVATVCGDNAAVVSLLRRVASSLRVTWQGGEREFVLGLER